jgi:hypothetical protein
MILRGSNPRPLTIRELVPPLFLDRRSFIRTVVMGGLTITVGGIVIPMLEQARESFKGTDSTEVWRRYGTSSASNSPRRASTGETAGIQIIGKHYLSSLMRHKESSSPRV